MPKKSEITKKTAGSIAQLPAEHIIPNNRLTNKLCEAGTPIGEFEFDVGSKSCPAVNRCVLAYDLDSPAIITSKQYPMSEFDRQVYDAVTSLCLDGRDIITPMLIYRTMNGSDTVDCMSKIQYDAIVESVERMGKLNVTIDVTNELAHHMIDQTKCKDIMQEASIRTHLLALKSYSMKYYNADGPASAKAWKMYDMPVLYSYSSMVNQVLTLPASLLDIKDGNGRSISSSTARINIKGYLMRRIGVMRGKTKVSQRILLSSIYNILPPTNNRGQLKRYKDYIVIVLNYWITQGFIQQYQFIKRNRSDYAIDIVVS